MEVGGGEDARGGGGDGAAEARAGEHACGGEGEHHCDGDVREMMMCGCGWWGKRGRLGAGRVAGRGVGQAGRNLLNDGLNLFFLCCAGKAAAALELRGGKRLGMRLGE